MKAAIVLSAGTVGLGVARALGELGVPIVMFHYDERDFAHLSKYVTEAVPAPHPEKYEEAYIDLLLRYADRYGGSLLIPASDESLSVLARHKKTLSEMYEVACPDLVSAETCLDKKLTYFLAEEYGIPAPVTRLPRSPEEAGIHAEEVGFPLLVKPCMSHSFYAAFGRKMFTAESQAEMLEIYGRAAEEGLEVMLQEIIPGSDDQVVNYNAYAWEGEVLTEFTAEHVRNGPTMYGSPRVARSCEIPDVIAPGRQMLQALGFSGYACTEFKKDSRDGVFKLMEVNARHNLSTLLSVRCGINFPWLEYRHRLYGDMPEHANFRTGVYWIDLTRDVSHGVRNYLQERYSPAQYLRPYLQPHVFALFDRRDPLPFRRHCRHLPRQAARMILHTIRGGGKIAAVDLDSPRATKSISGE